MLTNGKVVFIAAQWSASGDFGSLSMTVLAIQLPLTALWASTSLEERVRQAQIPDPAKQRPFAMGSRFSKSSEKHLLGKEGNASTIATGSVPSTQPRKGKGVGRDEYRLNSIPMTTTIGSLDVEVKMDERDMV